MRKLPIATALVFFTAPAFACDLTLGTRLGPTEDAVQAALTEIGWELRKLDTEDGMIAAYAVFGEAMAEIYVDPATGDMEKISNEA